MSKEEKGNRSNGNGTGDVGDVYIKDLNESVKYLLQT